MKHNCVIVLYITDMHESTTVLLYYNTIYTKWGVAKSDCYGLTALEVKV